MSDEDTQDTQAPDGPDEEPRQQIEPIGDRIVVEVVQQAESIDAGGTLLYIPDQARNTPQVGVVIAVGDGIPYRGAGKVMRVDPATGDLREEEVHVPQKLPVKLGDYVVYGKFSGVEVQLGTARKRDTFFILRSDEVLAKLPGYVPPSQKEAAAEVA